MKIEQKRAFITQMVYYLIWAAIFVLIVKYGIPMLSPFVLGFLVAWLMRRPTRFFARRLNLPYKPLAFFLVILFYGIIGFIISMVGVWAVAGVIDVVEAIPHMYSEHFMPALLDITTRFEAVVYEMDASLFELIDDMDNELIKWLTSGITSLSTWTIKLVSNVATSIPGLFVKLVLMIISSVFIALDYDHLVGFCMNQMNEKTKILFLQIKRYVVGTLLVCIVSYGIIMSITFVELSIAFKIIGFQHAFVIAGCIAIFDILPVLGTGGIMIPWGVFTLLQGNISLGVKLLMIYVIITVIRNILEPKIVGSQLGLHPVITLSSMFAGAQLLGVWGLFGFPIGISLLVYLNNNGSISIFKSEPTAPAM